MEFERLDAWNRRLNIDNASTMKTIKTLLLIATAAPLFAWADSVPAPAIQPGDTWT